MSSETIDPKEETTNCISSNSNSSAPKQLLRLTDLKDLGIWQSKSTLMRLEQNNRFPKRIRLSDKCICWDRTEVLNWLDARKTERASWHYADAS
jgi:predicted DNA-binding transcriptional regulator AlpA